MRKIKLNGTKSINSVNIDLFTELSLQSTNKILPISEIYKIIDSSEIFVKENNESDLFRISATINPLFTNILTNITGNDSLATFNETKFRDKFSPSNASLNIKDNLTYKNSIVQNKLTNNGWIGYYNPLLLSKDCKQIDLHPKRSELNLLGENGENNWDICITYPYLNESHELVSNGLPINKFEIIEFNGRNMVRFTSVFNHGLKTGEKVFISGLSNQLLDGEYLVYKTGISGELKNNYFIVDISLPFSLTPLTKFKRIFNGKKSNYYFRKFKKVKTLYSPTMVNNDYNLFQMGFANNVFGDNLIQINFNEEIDLSDLIDNFKRPITELYITFIKKSNSLFSSVRSGFELNYLENTINNIIPDSRKIVNKPGSIYPSLENSISINQDEFYGDLIEFNDYEVKEIILNDIQHRFNTNNRDIGGFINVDGSLLNMGNRYEGYLYNPHHKIVIRELSDYVEQGSVNDNKPSYAIDLGDGRFLWRDVYDYANSPNLEIPFLNGCHYINNLINLHLKRQDPFGLYGIYYNTFPRDGFGEIIDNNEIKINDDEC